jgi:hypothetical protein
MSTSVYLHLKITQPFNFNMPRSARKYYSTQNKVGKVVTDGRCIHGNRKNSLELIPEFVEINLNLTTMWFSIDCLLYVPTATSIHIFLEMQRKKGHFEERKKYFLSTFRHSRRMSRKGAKCRHLNSSFFAIVCSTEQGIFKFFYIF